jgi:hypothetical protein
MSYDRKLRDLIVEYKTPTELGDHDFNRQLAMYSQGMGDAIDGGACTYETYRWGISDVVIGDTHAMDLGTEVHRRLEDCKGDYATLEARLMAWFAEGAFYGGAPLVKDDGNIPVEAIDNVSRSAKSEALNTTSRITITKLAGND